MISISVQHPHKTQVAAVETQTADANELVSYTPNFFRDSARSGQLTHSSVVVDVRDNAGNILTSGELLVINRSGKVELKLRALEALAPVLA